MGRKPLIVIVVLTVAAAGGGALWLLQGASPEGADANNPEQVALGKGVYGSRCASCHGARLEGQANWRRPLPAGGLPAPPHDASGHTWHHPDRHLFEITKYGGQAKAPPTFKSNMPGFADKLTDREIWAVIAYIKSRWPAQIRQRQAAINERLEKK